MKILFCVTTFTAGFIFGVVSHRDEILQSLIDSITTPLWIYHLFIVLLMVYFIVIATTNKTHPKQGELIEKLMNNLPPDEANAKYEYLSENVLEKEQGWINSLAKFTPILLAGCLTYFFLEGSVEHRSNLKIWIGVIAGTALINMFFSVGFWIAGFFQLSWRLGEQDDCKMHRCIVAINDNLLKRWHVFPFLSLLIQAYCSGAVIIILTFY